MEDTEIRKNLKTYHKTVEMPGGYEFDHVDTLKRIDLYYMSKFRDGNKDKRGRRKPFKNITKTPIDLARKFIDIDMKDIIAHNELPGEDQEWKVWLMIQRLKRWLKGSIFGVFMNDIVDDFPKYGHVFAKRASDGKWYRLRVHNMRFDPSSQSFATDAWFIEVTSMTRSALIEAAKNWNGKDEIKRLLDLKEPSYQIYICHERNDEGNWDRSFKAGLFDYKRGGQVVRGTEALINNQNTFEPGYTLHEDVMDKEDFNYREEKWEDVAGRRLGYGFGEYLFENQISENEITYLEKIALHLKALQIWATKDAAIGGNLLNDAESGDLLRTAEAPQPLQKDNSDLAAFNNARAGWNQNTERKTFSYDAGRGDSSPSGTPLGLARINVGQIISFFDGKKERLGMFLENLLLEDVIPQFRKENSKEHLVSILSTAPRIEKFLRWYAKCEVDRQAYDWALSGEGYFPDEATRKQEEDRIFNELIRRRTQSIKAPDGYYEDAKYNLRINIVGENEDAGAADTIISIMQAIVSNPVVLQNPATRTMILRTLELKGMSAIDLDIIQEIAQEMPQVMGQLPTGPATAAPKSAGPAMAGSPSMGTMGGGMIQ